MIIRVYDVERLVNRWFDDKAIYGSKKMGVITNGGRVLFFDDEAICRNVYTIDDSVGIYLTDKPKRNKIYTMAQYRCDTTVREVMEEAECEECDLLDFLRDVNHNARTMNNYNILMKEIENLDLCKSY